MSQSANLIIDQPSEGNYDRAMMTEWLKCGAGLVRRVWLQGCSKFGSLLIESECVAINLNQIKSCSANLQSSRSEAGQTSQSNKGRDAALLCEG